MEVETNKMKQPLAFNVMAKPAGPACNLACEYCFYLDKEKFFASDEQYRMPDDVLEEFTRQYIAAQDVPEVCFAWQGESRHCWELIFFAGRWNCSRNMPVINGSRIRFKPMRH